MLPALRNVTPIRSGSLAAEILLDAPVAVPEGEIEDVDVEPCDLQVGAQDLQRVRRHRGPDGVRVHKRDEPTGRREAMLLHGRTLPRRLSHLLTHGCTSDGPSARAIDPAATPSRCTPWFSNPGQGHWPAGPRTPSTREFVRIGLERDARASDACAPHSPWMTTCSSPSRRGHDARTEPPVRCCLIWLARRSQAGAGPRPVVGGEGAMDSIPCPTEVLVVTDALIDQLREDEGD
jgi:hypothetical protein